MACSPPQGNGHRFVRLSILTALVFGISTLALLLAQATALPIITWLAPSLRTTFYDLGFYGAYPTESFASFHLSAPRPNIVQWDASCDEGLILLDPSGPSVSHTGPTILKADGTLVWTTDQYQTTTNLKVQRYRGLDFLTFWSGHKEKSVGWGTYYMLDAGYEIVHKVEAVGENLHGDLHDFEITGDDTALFTIYNVTQADLTSMGMGRTKHGWITDSVFQEVDIATGDLLFEWRASEHFDAAASFMTHPFGGYVRSIPFDFFQINSVQKDSDGNFLISSRHLHSVMCIDGRNGDVLWVLGGIENEFKDLDDGEATNFGWQHDARWVSEPEGTISLFDNSMAWPHVKASDSKGRIIKINTLNRTATQVQTYTSLHGALSSSQGSLQVLQDDDGDRVFVGWGSSAAYTEHSMDGQLLCETHFAASALFWWERVKSYRVTKVASWSATPGAWDPNAVIRAGKLYVSWNGATEVALWELQGSTSSTAEEWRTIDIVAKHKFEDVFVLPADAAVEIYRVVAFDAKGTMLRRSNVVASPILDQGGFILAAALAMMCVTIVLSFWWCRRRSLSWHKLASIRWDRLKYNKVR